MHPNSVMIATPHMHGHCVGAYKKSMCDLVNMLTRAGLTHGFLDCYNESLITRGRNTFASHFMAGDLEWLWFIDSDIECSKVDAAHLIEMMQSGADIAAGCYRRKEEPEKVYVVQHNGKLLTADDLDTMGTVPFECNGYAGTGFMMIHRRVFEALREAHPEWAYDGRNFAKEVVELYAYFQVPIENRVELSEDQFFCYRARELGIKLLVHPNVRLAHWGHYRFS